MQDWVLIGLGGAGSALAAHATLRGARIVAWHDGDPEIDLAIAGQGGLDYDGIFGSGRLVLPAMTADAADAAAAARTIVVSVTADRHADVARALAPALTREHLVVLHTGYVGGTRVFETALVQAGATRPFLAETINTLHLAGKPSAGRVFARSHKRWLEIAGPTTDDVTEALARLGPILPELSPGANPLANGLNNPNCIGHVPAMIGNLALLGGSHGGLTEGLLQFDEARAGLVQSLCDAFEAERVRIVQALGFTPLPIAEFGRRAYPEGSRLTEGVPRFGPKLQARFFTEDVPCALVPLESLAAAVDLPSPVTSALTTLASIAAGRDFRTSGRTVESLGQDWVRANTPALS